MSAGDDLVAVVSEHTDLQPYWRRFVGACPFHGGSGFMVEPLHRMYICHGCGRAGGSVDDFVRHLHQVGRSR